MVLPLSLEGFVPDFICVYKILKQIASQAQYTGFQLEDVLAILGSCEYNIIK